MIFEVCLFLMMAILTLVGCISLLCRIIMCVVRLVKGDKEKRELSAWSFVGCLLPPCVLMLYFFAQNSLKTTSSHYIWAFAVIALIAFVLLGMMIYGCIKNVSSTGLTKAQKVYNYFVMVLMLVSIVYIYYWQMFMFWKL